tara:strand:+ start:149 stop:427 length:279 start_codon:yes stop_codon:yes gene_type:complete
MSLKTLPELVRRTALEIREWTPIPTGKKARLTFAFGVNVNDMDEDGDKYPFGSSSNLVNVLSLENTTGRKTSDSITWDVSKLTAGLNWTDSG